MGEKGAATIGGKATQLLLQSHILHVPVLWDRRNGGARQQHPRGDTNREHNTDPGKLPAKEELFWSFLWGHHRQKREGGGNNGGNNRDKCVEGRQLAFQGTMRGAHTQHAHRLGRPE